MLYVFFVVLKRKKSRSTMCCGFLAEKELGQSYPRRDLHEMQLL